ncbi:unnamed protein product [Psylliodes chrysocephalus]|uniref:Uncharacterized protein n=1 Tax=Psylliodes chrysocephalus TaxID=3402493 RepID=A0A9P0GDL5_9CUCU|nr:unnamed protein product [Psylliodes chrysocephala]
MSLASDNTLVFTLDVQSVLTYPKPLVSSQYYKQYLNFEDLPSNYSSIRPGKKQETQQSQTFAVCFIKMETCFPNYDILMTGNNYHSEKVKKCPHNSEHKAVKINARSEGFKAYKINYMLRKEIFLNMRPDTISFTAKTDSLICAVARRYLKNHRDNQIKLVASRKMRQLAALLIEIKKKSQRMPVTSYTHNILKKISNKFDGCITESEKNLMQSFKRVVIRGKRRSGVPVLFTQEMAKNQTNLVDKNNIYLFPNPKSSKSISDPQVIYKHIRFADEIEINMEVMKEISEDEQETDIKESQVMTATSLETANKTNIAVSRIDEIKKYAKGSYERVLQDLYKKSFIINGTV